MLWNGFWAFLFFIFDEINRFSNFWICETSIFCFDFIGNFGDHSILALLLIFESFDIPTPPCELIFNIELICSLEKSGRGILFLPYFLIISSWLPWFLITKNCCSKSSILLLRGDELKFFCFLFKDEESENTSGEWPLIILVLHIVSGIPDFEPFLNVLRLFWTLRLNAVDLSLLKILIFN